MMHRPNFAQGFANFARNSVAKIATDFKNYSSETIMAMIVQSGIMATAERENRRRTRHHKRERYSYAHQETGLNGKRAVARRLRQIAAGQLTAANGLVV